MFDSSNSLQQIVAISIIALWVIFAIGFLLFKRKSKSVAKRRDPRALSGLFLQVVAMGIIWEVRRPLVSTEFELPLQLSVSVAALSLMIVSVFVTLFAVRILGEEWTVEAQIHKDHKLITRGPYGIVRNPIYTGIMGMMIATGLSISEFYIILPAIILYIVGFIIRIRSEERLLREAFGAEFDEYCRRVPAIFPRLFNSPHH